MLDDKENETLTEEISVLEDEDDNAVEIRQYEEAKAVNNREKVDNYERVLFSLSKSLRKLIIDSGATKSVVGAPWFKDFLLLLTNKESKELEYRRENRFFRFGNGVRYPSRQEVKLPITLGRLKTVLFVSIVDANIPLLVGAPDLKRLGLTVNFEKDRAYVSKTKEYFNISKDDNNHLTLPITIKPMKKDTHEILEVSHSDEKERKKKVKKVHQILGHPREETLKRFYKDSSQNDEDTMKTVVEVS